MAVTSLDILNLSHSLKDICEVNCNTPECLSQTLNVLLQYNLIQANLEFGKQFECGCNFPSCLMPPQSSSPIKQGTGLDLTNPNFTHRTEKNDG